MININKLVAGRVGSFVHNGVVDTVAKRAGVDAPNWLQAATVTRRGVFSGNIADERTYTNAMVKLDPDYESSGKAWFRHVDGQPGIVAHKQTGKPYLAVINPRNIKEAYFVDGTPATPAQLEAIAAFKKSNHKGAFAVYDLEKVECEGYVDEEKDED